MAQPQQTTESLETLHFVANELNAKDLENFLDQYVRDQLESRHIPGATIAVVKDGKLLLAKGYGYADLENKTPVVADKTLFRTGSVAKLFTWTAVMQLVEQGKLDLNAYVNTYLGNFSIPNAYPQPITLRHLLTHTAGFEDSLMGYARQRPQDFESLSSLVSKRIPARVYPPGKVTGYSNYGTTLAGYIVERVSEVPYERYVEENLFKPLRMTHTVFQQPPLKFPGDIAKEYTYSQGKFRAGEFELIQIIPAGTVSATATDIANFMIAHLNRGMFEDQRILQETTAVQMQNQQFANDARLSGMGLGFYEGKVQGQRVLMHHGDTSRFYTLLALVPQSNLGVYVAYNAPGGFVARDLLLSAILERYYPAPTIPQPTPQVGADTHRFAGLYRSTRTPQSTLEKLLQLVHPSYQPLRLRATDQGTLELHSPALQSFDREHYKPSSWFQVGTDEFRRSDGKDTLVFAQHSPSSMFMDSKPPMGHPGQRVQPGRKSKCAARLDGYVCSDVPTATAD